MITSCSQWLLDPYGAPTSTSEVNCIPDFYCVEALTAFGPPATSIACQVPDAVVQTAEVPVGILVDITGGAAQPARPAV